MGLRSSWRISARRLRAAAASLLLAAAATAQTPAEPPAPAPEPAAPTAIPMPEVTARAEEVIAQLREVESQLEPSRQVSRIREALPVLTGALGDRISETQAAVGEKAPLDFLADLENEWRSRKKVLAEWGDELTERATQLEGDLQATKSQLELWKETQQTARSDGAPRALRERIDATLAAIQATRNQVEKQRDEVLTLQSQASALELRVTESLDELVAARAEVVGEVFEARAPPIWSQAYRQELRRDRAQGIGYAAEAQISVVSGWLEEESRGRFAFQLLLAAALALAFAAARSRLAAVQEAGPGLEQAAPIFQRPALGGLLLALLFSPLIYPQAPLAALSLLFAAALIPAVLVLRRLVASALHPLLYSLVALFLFDQIRQLLLPLPSIERLLFLLQLATALGFLIWLRRPSRLARIPLEARRSRLLRWVALGVRLGIALLAVALVAGVLGYARLERLLGHGVLTSAYAAVMFYAAVRITTALLRFALRVRPLRSLGTVMRNRALLEQRGARLLRFLGYASWAWVTLGRFEIREPLVGATRTALTAELSIGAVSLSLGDLLAFVLTVWASFLLSRFLRFVLEEEVYPRVRLRRGMPYAISTLAHYLVLLFGFLLAVAATGINLDRIAFLAGALGVGIGFGLQNVVNNFVSGLILLFERPVQLGDTVELGDLWGEVRRIGIRSSVVRTFDGAEVIVPNGDLISQQVTNWTLSDRHRRVEVKVGVAYGTDPERVLGILREVAAAQPDVLAMPEPQTLFDGFGDSSLDFRLRVWIRDFDRGLPVRSELSVALNAALAAAGITIPFPQRDLHVIDVPGGGSSAPPSA